MQYRAFRLVALALCLFVCPWSAIAHPKYAAAPTFIELVQKLSEPMMTACGINDPNLARPDPDWLHLKLFEALNNELLDFANAHPDDAQAIPHKLAAMKKMAEKLPKATPGDPGFDYEIIPFGKGLLVNASFNFSASFVYFAKPDGGKNPKPWHLYDVEDHSLTPEASITLMTLTDAPADTPRFLAISHSWGCAGNTGGVTYDIFQWNAADEGKLQNVSSREGSYNLEGNDDSEIQRESPISDSFLKADKAFQTGDHRLVLPYCRFSPIDTWDHATLCSVDIYDLSGPQVRYLETRSALPDLQALASAFDYAEKHDRRALLGYVATPAVADALVQMEIPSALEDFKREKHDDGSEDVTIGLRSDDEIEAKFHLMKRDGNWIITDYSLVNGE